MIIADSASHDDNAQGGGILPHSTGLAPDSLSEVRKPVFDGNSQIGVSTKNALSGTVLNISNKKTKIFLTGMLYE